MNICLRRREFIAGLGGAAAWPVAGSAQQRAMPVVGWLSTRNSEADAYVLQAFRRGLSRPTSSASRWVGEFVPGFEANIWNGFGAPRSTPTAIVERLNREINDALADPKVKARLTDRGSTVHPGTPADFAKFVGDETEKWGKVIRTAGIRAE